MFEIGCMKNETQLDHHVHFPMWSLNPLRANFFRGNINIYLHFVSFLHIDATQVVEILSQMKQEPANSL